MPIPAIPNRTRMISVPENKVLEKNKKTCPKRMQYSTVYTRMANYFLQWNKNVLNPL